VAAVLSGLAASFGEEVGAAREENEDHQEQRTKLVARMGLPKSVSKEHVASDLDHLVDDDDDDGND